jgi:glyoxylase I family protein
MTFEHVALNLPDYETAAKWYCTHLRMQVVREKPGTMIFLGDESRAIVLELYENPAAPVLDFAKQHPLTLHIAFAVDNVRAEGDRLIEAGCQVSDPYKQVGGDSMIMLRDPFGVSIQLVNRGA